MFFSVVCTYRAFTSSTMGRWHGSCTACFLRTCVSVRPAIHSRRKLEVVEVYKRWLPFVLITFLAVCVPAVQSAAASWSSFKDADFENISISLQLGGSETSYLLEMGSDPNLLEMGSDPNTPKIKIGGVTYDVNWIQAVYLVAEPKSATFTATEGSNSKQWTWDDKDNPGQIAGYRGTGSTRLDCTQPMTFSFDGFEIISGSVLAGFHLGYQDGASEITGWYKGDITTEEGIVPEPASLAMLACFLGAATLARKRRGC